MKQRIGKVKTEASKKSIPLDDVLIEELLAWRRETPYAQDSDYVFASTKMRGKQPYWMSRIMQHHIKPVATKTGIEIKGWHTLRHSYTTLLRQNNNNPKVVQGLLRHASYSIMMNVYDEAMSEEKRNAHRGVIQQGFGRAGDSISGIAGTNSGSDGISSGRVGESRTAARSTTRAGCHAAECGR